MVFFGRWPVFKVNIPSNIGLLLSKLKCKEISLNDIKDTDFEYLIDKFHDDMTDVEISYLLWNICNFNYQNIEYIYLFVVDDEIFDDFLFFDSIDELENIFYERYCYNIKMWEDMEDWEIEYWYELSKNELSSLALDYFLSD